jgi:transposase
VGGDHCGRGPARDERETLRRWIPQAAVDAGEAPGVSSDAAAQIRELKRTNAGLEQTVEILKAAAFFVRERDPRHR